jgi:DUF1009 family protein
MTSDLGLVAGSGRLPFEVAEAARDHGVRLAVVAIEGNTDLGIRAFASGPFTCIAPGELGRLIDFLKEARVEEAVLAGAVAKREILRDPSRLKPDARALKLLARLSDRGDDSILRGVADEIEAEGIRVVSPVVHLGERMTQEGPLVPGLTAEGMETDLELGIRVAKTLGVHDVGQTVVVKGGTVVAVEALEGTDATIRRAAELAGPGAVAVKVAKPGQDLRFDVPAIGPDTVAVARECGVSAIGLEAGCTLILDPRTTLPLAREAGVALVGLRTPS